MKTLLKIHTFLVMALVMFACREDDTMPAKGHVQFSLGSDLIDHSSGRVMASIPDGASVLLSIEDDSGNPVLTLEKIDIIKFGDQYASVPLELENKSYQLTDFMIVDENDEVIYATPRQGAVFARLVKKPLPIAFTVLEGKMTNVLAQVVRTAESTPEDFGYVSFTIDVAAFPEFKVSVFALEDGKLGLTSAQAYLLHDADTVYKKLLAPRKVNEIIFKGEPAETYTLVVMKPGYGKFSRTFTLQALRDELDNMPLEIILRHALTMLVSPEIGSGNFRFSMAGIAGKKVIVDWDDGQIDTVELKAMQENVFAWSYEHSYSDFRKMYFVSITGDIDHIQELAFGWTGGPASLSLMHMSGLERFGVSFNSGLTHLDFTGCPELRMVSAGFAQIRSINISANKKLRRLLIEELPLTTEDADKIVNDLYNHVVTDNIREGELLFQVMDENGMPVFPGPPSEESIQKLHTLRDWYDWYIEPFL